MKYRSRLSAMSVFSGQKSDGKTKDDALKKPEQQPQKAYINTDGRIIEPIPRVPSVPEKIMMALISPIVRLIAVIGQLIMGLLYWIWDCLGSIILSLVATVIIYYLIRSGAADTCIDYLAQRGLPPGVVAFFKTLFSAISNFWH